MSDLRKAAQALVNQWESNTAYPFGSLVDALRAALAQPEQEPVLHKWAALFEDPNNDWQAGYESARRWVLEVGLQSISAPFQRKPLTEEEIFRVAYAEFPYWSQDIQSSFVTQFARAIEKAHGVQNV